MAEQPKDVARAFVEGFQDQRDPGALEKYVAHDMIDHSPTPGAPAGWEGVRAVCEMLWAGLPDMRVEIHQQVAEGDLVATRKSFVGTHGGELFGVPATGKPIRIDLMDLVRVSEGQIVEHWNIVDVNGLLKQMGALPS